MVRARLPCSTYYIHVSACCYSYSCIDVIRISTRVVVVVASDDDKRQNDIVFFTVSLSYEIIYVTTDVMAGLFPTCSLLQKHVNIYQL